MVKKPTWLVEDAGGTRFMYRKDDVLFVDSEKPVKLDTTTGLKINKKYDLSKNPKEIYSVFNI